MIRFIAFTCTLLTAALCSADTVYQSTDKRGNPEFSDQQRPGARPVEVQPTNTAPGVAPTEQPTSTPEANAFTGYKTINLGVTSSIPNGLAPTTIGIDLQPALQPGHWWQLLLDGSVQAEGKTSSATIERLERGTHQLQLRVINADGAVIGTSVDKEVFVFWPGGNR